MPDVELHERIFESANVLGIEVGTNCPKGGKSSEGGRTVFRLVDQGGTDIRLKVDGQEIKVNDAIEIVLAGDCEHHTFVEALEFALVTYKNQFLKNSGATKVKSIN